MFASGVLRRGLLSASALVSVLSFASAQAAPGGGHYVSGDGHIGKSGHSVTVKQSSTTGIIDWNKFSIGKKGNVAFDNGSGGTLNIVTGGNLSRIAGSLSASGSLYIMNSAGVIVNGTGRVLTGGNFMATGGTISDNAFDHDRFKLGKLPGDVLNRGTIQSGGDVRLAGSNVGNSGSISATDVHLQARNTLNVSGTIRAHDAAQGGRIVATGKTIDIKSTADLSADGSQSGGMVRIGGAMPDGRSDTRHHLRTAKDVTIKSGAQIKANSAQGSAGNIVIASDGTTTLAGNAVARGATQGGFIETSGKELHIGNGARVSTFSHQETGTWLIDPTDFVIAASGGDITGAQLSSELAANNITIQSSQGAHGTNGDIIVNDAVAWSSANSLTLDAFHSIAVNAQISASDGAALSLVADDGGTGGGYAFNGIGRVVFSGYSDGDNTHLTINGQAYALENSIAALASAISGNAAGFYALAGNYDASADATYAASPIATTFNGTFEGLGNTISNLTIENSAGGDIGLFAQIGSTGTARDLTLANVSVTGGDNSNTGGLVGTLAGGTISRIAVSGAVSGGQENNTGGVVGNATGGIISQSSSSALVTTASGFAEDFGAGGLVGNAHNLSITQSFATGDVNGRQLDAGGLVGILSGVSNISESYATGNALSTSADDAGGLVGAMRGGTINQAFSIGAVAESAEGFGGFIGDFSGGSVGDAYWDTETSGHSEDGARQTVGLQTKSLQKALPAGFDSSAWGIVAKTSFPFLKWQFAAGEKPGVISGTVRDLITGRTATGGVPISLYAGGNLVSALSTYADGTFYLLSVSPVPASGVAAVSSSAIGFSDVSSHGIVVPTEGLDIKTGDASLSALGENLQETFGSQFGGITSVEDLLTHASGDLTLTTTGDFDFDQSVSVKTHAFTIDGSGNVSQSSGAIQAGSLNVEKSSGNTALTGENKISSLDDIDIDEGDFSFTDAKALTTDLFSVAKGNVALKTDAGRIFFSTNVTVGGNLVLHSAAGISQKNDVLLSAKKISGSSNGNVSFTFADNKIAALGNFSTNGHKFDLSTFSPLVVAGTADTGLGALVLSSAQSISIPGVVEGGSVALFGGNISEPKRGAIRTALLIGFGQRVVMRGRNNQIAELGGFTANNNLLVLWDNEDLTVRGVVDAGADGGILLETLGRDQDIAVDNTLSGIVVDLVSTGDISESPKGAIETSLLNVVAETGITLTSGKNDIGKLGSDTTKKGPNKITL